MAFKREGDDGQWLNLLKKRRVAELLGEDIPEDEVLLMKNGRLCCLVCHHRPTFDTSEVLQVHRNGKKHQSYVEQFIAEKSELQDLVRKRQHEELLKTGKIHTLGVPTASNTTWLGCAPYDPRVKKRKIKPDQRKQSLQLNPSFSGEESKLEIGSTPASSLPGCIGSKPSIQPQTIAEYRNFQNRNSSLNNPIKPYISKRKAANPGTSAEISHMRTTHKITDVSVRTFQLVGSTSTDSKDSKKAVLKSSVAVPKPIKPKNDKLPNYGPQTQNDDEKRKLNEKYLQARGAGWKKDQSGKWVKDEDVEFDSDEEPPDLP